MAFGSHPQPLHPHVSVGEGVDAVGFYKAACNARCFCLQMDGGGVQALRATLSVSGGEVRLYDVVAEHGDISSAPATHAKANVACTVSFSPPGAVDAACTRVVSAGATVFLPPADMFRDPRPARARDPFGPDWAFNAALDPH